MPVFRGLGGAGSSDDAATIGAVTEQSQLAATKANEASASATQAASSSATAVTKADEASTSATNAANSATAAASSATTASTAATAAGNAQTAAETAQTAAEAAQTAAELAADSAVQPDDLATVATSGDYEDLINKPTFTSGTVTSVDLTVPTGLSVSGGPITSTGTFAIALASGYSIPTTIKQGTWDDSYTFVAAFPSQTSNSGKYLTTDGSTLSWATVANGDIVDDTSPQLGGALDTNGYAINFGDNDKATFGDSEDLWLYHDGGTSYLYDRGTGNLRIITNSTVSIDGVSGGEFMATFVSNGAVSLYFDNSNKFQTTSTGINVNGNIAVSGTVDGRDVAADGTKLDGIESGATADQTASEILALLLTVDGTGSTLDADTLDGNEATAFATAAQGALADSAVQPGDNISTLTNDSGYLTAETNDLTAAVTWANVPDANITQSSVTQHQAALSIAGSQLTGTIDGGTY